MRARRFDVCIVGSGFAGTFLGLRLAERGIDTMIVEAGGDVPPEAPPEGDRHLLPHREVGDGAFPVEFNRTIGIGGTSRRWNGVISRFVPGDFESRTRYDLFADWPIRYSDLEAHYAEAERALESQPGSVLSCAAGERAPSLPGAEGMSLAAVPMSSRTPGGGPIRLREVEIPRFLASGHGTLLARRPAIRLRSDTAGTVAAVEVRAPGGVQLVEADRYVVAAGVVETVRLLLSSTSTRHPRGLGNDHDLLGRFVHSHPRPRLHVPRDPLRSGMSGLYRSLGAAEEFRNRGLAAVCVDYNFFEADPAVDLTLEMEPAWENCVRLDPEARDAWGRPLAVVDCHATDIDRATRAEAERLQSELARALLVGGEVRTGEPKWFHPAGGCRMGEGPERGVVDGDGRVFGTRNLFVAGTSVFPTSGATNPTLTVVALALRLADHLTGSC